MVKVRPSACDGPVTSTSITCQSSKLPRRFPIFQGKVLLFLFFPSESYLAYLGSAMMRPYTISKPKNLIPRFIEVVASLVTISRFLFFVT